MTRTLPFAALSLVVLSLAGCDKPAPRAPRSMTPETPAAPPVAAARERAERIRWDEDAAAFVLDGKPLPVIKAWTFEGAADGFTVAGGEVTPAHPSGLKVVNLAPDPAMRSPKGLDIDGARYPLVVVRLTRARPGGLWDGSLHYSTAAHGEAERFSARPLQGADPGVNETTVLVYDLSQSPAAADWKASRIDQLRIDTDDLAGGEFLVREVAVAANPQAPR